MSTAKKFMVAAFAAMLLLAMAAGGAAALRSIESSSTLLVLLSRALTLEGFANVVCEVQLSTTLTNRSSAKTANAVIGRVTPRILRCSEGTATILNAPWNVKYVSFSGTLPSGITGLTDTIERAQFRATNFLTCLVTSESTGLQRVTGGTTVGNLEGRPYGLANVTTSGACTREEVRLLGTFEPTNGPITIRLV